MDNSTRKSLLEKTFLRRLSTSDNHGGISVTKHWYWPENTDLAVADVHQSRGVNERGADVPLSIVNPSTGDQKESATITRTARQCNVFTFPAGTKY